MNKVLKGLVAVAATAAMAVAGFAGASTAMAAEGYTYCHYQPGQVWTHVRGIPDFHWQPWRRRFLGQCCMGFWH